MIRPGTFNSLTLLRRDDKGGWLDADTYGEVLLPARQMPADSVPGSQISVFVLLDDGELTVTTVKPHALVGEFVGLKVVSVTRLGAFLDWGLKKDLFVPTREQAVPMQVGKYYVVHLYLDYEGRVAASSKLDRFLTEGWPEYERGAQVKLLPYAQTPMGFKCIVDGRFIGMLFRNELFGRVTMGRGTVGYVRQVREDGKLDLTLTQTGKAGSDQAGDKILQVLQRKGGFMPVGDKSAPELISQLFNMSKGSFKKAIGGLYKQGLIAIEEDGIRLTAPVDHD